MLDSHPGTEELEKERQILDVIKEELNQAYRSYDELLDDESAKGATYRYFDLCDWEFIECLVRLSEILCSVEQQEHEEFESSRQETESSHSARSRVSGSLRSSRLLVMSKRAAKLKVEMKYLDQETNLTRIQLEREITLTDAEEEASKLVMSEEVKRDSLQRYEI